MSNRISSYYGFLGAINSISVEMRDEATDVHTEEWQSMKIGDRPEAAMKEIMNIVFAVHMNPIESIVNLQGEIKPNLPWAEKHFLERVGGEPINPGEEWKNWPWANSSNKHRDESGIFNHNYMERYWPKEAGEWRNPNSIHHNYGIRGPYGDLNDVVDLLVDQPLTRQAYLPVWFPEDTGLQNRGRKPCSLGYQFIMRDRKLSIHYYIRSCDFLRHFRDDIYLTVRLLIWVLSQCKSKSPEFWGTVLLGDFHMHITSLHMFINDWNQMFGDKNEN